MVQRYLDEGTGGTTVSTPGVLYQACKEMAARLSLKRCELVTEGMRSSTTYTAILPLSILIRSLDSVPFFADKRY